MGGFSLPDDIIAPEPFAEIVNLEDVSNCKDVSKGNLPSRINGLFGGILDAKIIICGGYDPDLHSYIGGCRKVTIVDNEIVLEDFAAFPPIAFGAFSQVFDQNSKKIIFSGGKKTGEVLQNDVAILDEEGQYEVIDRLPESVSDHCMVAISNSTLIIIGGMSLTSTTKKSTFVIRLNDST